MRWFDVCKTAGCGATLLLLIGCSSYGVIANTQKLRDQVDSDNYSTASKIHDEDENVIWIAFSGGGTRAAALAYGVLEELRDTPTASNATRCGLDEIDLISSVSGGSFPAAYYGLYGDRIFADFEKDFLRKNVEGHLIRSMFFSPLQWFRKTGRTEQAVKYFDKNLFHGATFADLKEKDGPLLLINATDLGYGVRFSFTQEYFDLLNSDISSFPVSRAVTASSAVPILFDPVVAMNYDGEKEALKNNGWFSTMMAATKKGNSPRLQMVTGGMSSYFDKSGHRFVHFVDGGITDNLGLRAIQEMVDMNGGIKKIYEKKGVLPPRRLVLISVNAIKEKKPTMDITNKLPSIKETMGAVTEIQLRYYTTSTLNLARRKMEDWAQELSTPDRLVETYFIQVRFDDVQDAEEQAFLNEIPTSFSLEEEHVDALIKAGRELLRNNPEFQRLIRGE